MRPNESGTPESEKRPLLPLVRTDDDGNVRWSWITHVAIGVGLGVAGWLVYLAALVQAGLT
jgi:hypothetical protein